MNLRPFELALVTIFAVAGLIGLAIISGYNPRSETVVNPIGGPVVIWGTVDASVFGGVLRSLGDVNEEFRQVSYVQKDARSFDQELINALAESRGPDIVFLPHEKLIEHRTKILPRPYEAFPLRDFQDRYVDGFEIFTLPDGVYAYPVAVDPLMMYWNRDIMATYGYIAAPTTWEALVGDVLPATVQRDFSRTITRSTVAFGEWRNVTNAHGIISMLLLQGGSALVSQERGQYQVRLNDSLSGSGQPLTTALTFYTNFASPSNSLYSWNRALPNDRSQFLAERLVLYFGKGSEARSIAAQNPNLNFDIAEVPQGASATLRRTYGTFYGLALLRSSRNPNGSLVVMNTLGSAGTVSTLAGGLGMAPAHRSLLAAGSNDRYGRIIYGSAPVTRGWLNPAFEQSNTVFTQAVEDILANRRRPTEAATDAVGRLRAVY